MPQHRYSHRFAARGSKLLAVVGLPLALALAGCEPPEVKKYNAPSDSPARDFTRLESYRLPDGWVRQEKAKDFSVATFQIGEGDKAVLATVSRLPGRSGGLEANIERWRGKVGLEPLKQDEMQKSLLWLTVDGEKTPYVDLANPAKSGTDRILGVVAERGPMTWFFKMQGPPEQVGQHKAAFEAFVESVKFGGTGASDG
jgi:hypothetical protein